MNEQKKVRIIEVVSYNPKWKEEYLKESEKLKKLFKDEIVDIYHIGSTSIPGISAKPVIDILLSVNDISKIDDYNEEMVKLGYEAKGEYGIPSRRFFLKGIYDRTHHIHAFEVGNPEIIRHLNFRDYIIAHPEEMKQYQELKKELAKEFRYDNEGYCDGKDCFIKNIDKKAAEWAKTRREA